MADNTTIPVPGTSGDVIRTIDHGGAKTPVSAMDKGGEAGESIVTDTNPGPVTNRASDGTEIFTVGQPGHVAVVGTVAISAVALPLPTGAATETKQDATITLLGAGLPAALDGSGGLQTAVVAPLPAGTNTIGNVGVVGTVPLPTGAAQDGTDGTGITQPTGGAGIRGWLSGIYKALTDRLPAALSNGFLQVSLKETITQPISAASLPLPSGAASSAKQDSQTTLLGGGLPSALDGSGNLKTAIQSALPAGGNVIGNVGINGTPTVDTELPAAALLADGTAKPTTPIVGAAGMVYNGTTLDLARGDTTNGAWVNIKSAVALALAAGAQVIGSISAIGSDTFGLTETAPATDTASSGVNGRLQRVAQRITSLIALLPGSLGQKAMSASLAVVFASDQSALAVTPAATENHLGQVGSNSARVTANLTVQTAAYASGNLMGSGVIALASAARVSGGGGMIVSLTLADNDQKDAAYEIVFFNANPTNSTFTDKTALTINSADLAKVVGSVLITAGNTQNSGSYTDFVANSVASMKAIDIKFLLGSGTTLYVAVMARQAVTPSSTTGLTLGVDILQD